MKKLVAILGLEALVALFFGNGKRKKLVGSDEDLQLGWGEAPPNTDFNFTVRPTPGDR